MTFFSDFLWGQSTYTPRKKNAVQKNTLACQIGSFRQVAVNMTELYIWNNHLKEPFYQSKQVNSKGKSFKITIPDSREKNISHSGEKKIVFTSAIGRRYVSSQDGTFALFDSPQNGVPFIPETREVFQVSRFRQFLGFLPSTVSDEFQNHWDQKEDVGIPIPAVPFLWV